MTAAPDSLEIPALPLWRGLAREPGVRDALPFRLTWDPRGFLVQQPSPALRRKLVEAYADPGYGFITAPPGMGAWANRLGDMLIDCVRRLIGDLSGLRVLEIGAGTTYVAQRLIEEFAVRDYVIVDPAVRDLRSAAADLPRLVPDFFPTPKLSGETFDLVISFNCLEHVDDAVDWLGSIVASLAGPEARVLLTCPDISRQFAIGDINALLHEHLIYLDDRGLANLMASAGLALDALESAEDMFTLLARPGDKEREEPARPDNGLLEQARKTFSDDLQAVCRTIRAQSAAGRRLAFHGANNGLNSLLYLAELPPAASPIVIDLDPQKEGLYLPACPVPVRRPSREAYQGAEVIYVSAVSFFDEIRQSIVTEHGVAAEQVRKLCASA